MSNARLRLAFAGETMFPHAVPRPEFASANSGLAKGTRAPFFRRAWGTSRFVRGGTHGSPAGPLLGRKAYGFPTPLPAHLPTEGGR
jgi:hypothetical protein